MAHAILLPQQCAGASLAWVPALHLQGEEDLNQGLAVKMVTMHDKLK